MKPVDVSDHALVRYLERVGGFAVEQLRRELGLRLAEAAQAGASTVTIDNFAYRIARDAEGRACVTTVLPVEAYKKPSPRLGRKARGRPQKETPE
jgi:hypothetical protein